MATIKSDLAEAARLSAGIQTSSGESILQSVNAAAQADTVTNVNCIGAYNGGMAVFSAYRKTSVRDASSIDSFAAKMNELDGNISASLSS